MDLQGRQLQSAINRPIALRMRPDLAVAPQAAGDSAPRVVKDPVSLRYFQLLEEEYAILQMLDGRVSLDELKRRFEQMFAPRQLSFRRLQAFLGRLHRDGLLLAETTGQGEQLLVRRARHRRERMRAALGSVLAIRFRGFDPQPLLDWLYPYCRWMFSAPVLAACLLLMASAVGLVVVQFDVLQSRLPGFYEFFSLQNAVWLMAAVAAAKVLHELSHALTCRHFDCECHEMGIMLLAFVPCLYCNVSDSWLLPNKWQRIAISAAGVFFELTLAAICTFLWWFSEPGLLNAMCLNIMLVCSLSSILFNGNPLLRYDGYYVLSDLAQVPNLAARSRSELQGKLKSWLLGVDELRSDQLVERESRWLIVYAVCSFAYRCLVVVTILWFCYHTLKPYGLQFLAEMLALAVVASTVGGPAYRGAQLVGDPRKRHAIRPSRALATAAVCLALIGAICFVPLPYRVPAAAVLEPADAQRVYVSVPGTLVSSVKVGETVSRGQILAVLRNREVDLDVAKLKGEQAVQAVHLQSLQARRARDATAAIQIPAAREAEAATGKRRAKREEDQRRLTLLAPVDGTVLPPPARRRPPSAEMELSQWVGLPSDDRNLGSYLATGSLFCLVGNPRQLEAVLVIDQAGVEFVEAGQHVWVHIDERPGTVLTGTISEVARVDLKVAPRELGGDGRLPTRTDEQGSRQPLDISYQARVRLDEHPHLLLAGARGQAKIAAGWQPLGSRFYRYLARTFRFQM